MNRGFVNITIIFAFISVIAGIGWLYLHELSAPTSSKIIPLPTKLPAEQNVSNEKYQPSSQPPPTLTASTQPSPPKTIPPKSTTTRPSTIETLPSKKPAPISSPQSKINTTPLASALMLTKPGFFLVSFPWQEGEQWRVETDTHGPDGAYDLNSGDQGAKSEVLAVADGVVILAKHNLSNNFNTYKRTGGAPGLGGIEDLGNFVIIAHDLSTLSLYLHLQNENIPPVKSGDQIKLGMRLGWEGDTGNSNGEHLHFSIINIQLFPSLSFKAKPKDQWGFRELSGSSVLDLHKTYGSSNKKMPEKPISISEEYKSFEPFILEILKSAVEGQWK